MFTGHGVERPKRFVHQDHLRIVGKHPRNCNPLLHPTRKLVRIGVGKSLQPNRSTVRFTSPAGLWREIGPKAMLPRTVSHGNNP